MRDASTRGMRFNTRKSARRAEHNREQVLDIVRRLEQDYNQRNCHPRHAAKHRCCSNERVGARVDQVAYSVRVTHVLHLLSEEATCDDVGNHLLLRSLSFAVGRSCCVWYAMCAECGRHYDGGKRDDGPMQQPQMIPGTKSPEGTLTPYVQIAST